MRSFVALLLVLSAVPLLAEDVHVQAPPRTISTSGESIVYVVPDEVVINLGVETFNADLEKSRSENDERSARMLKAIKALGVEDKHVQSDTLNVEIQYGDRRSSVVGYAARRSYSITLKDTKLFEKLVPTALQNGGNQIHGFQFRTSELRKHRDAARKMAIKAAKEKAVALAGELEMKVGKPRTINESGGYFYGGGWGGNSFANGSQNAVQAAGGEGESGETTPLGQIAVRADVSVTFDME
jgi:uncharacterized protein YggE